MGSQRKSKVNLCIRFGVFGIAVAAASAEPAQAAAQGRLSVLFIGVDDLNTKIGCYGATHVKTPNIDRLAARGIRFDNAYCQYPVCNPSRTSLLSGMYPEKTGVFGNRLNPRQKLPQALLLPELFKQNGYFTAGIGKITHGRFTDIVNWDAVENPRGRNHDEGEEEEESGGPLPFAWKATDNSDAEEPDGQIARRVVQLLEQHKERPFFIAAGFHKPHTAHVAPKKYFALYEPQKMPLPSKLGDPVPGLAAAKYYPELTSDQQRQIIHHYSAATTFMDAQLGLVLDALDRLNLWDKTLVVFWSDHGWHHGEHGGIWAKFTLLNESARVPLIVAGPGIQRGVSSGLVELVDLYPTLAAICGLPAPTGLQGQSFAGLLKHPAGPGKGAVYTVVQRAGKLARAMRTPRYTYIEYPDGSKQLFAASDLQEMDNLAQEPKHAGVLSQMKELLRETIERASR